MSTEFDLCRSNSGTESIVLQSELFMGIPISTRLSGCNSTPVLYLFHRNTWGSTSHSNREAGMLIKLWDLVTENEN